MARDTIMFRLDGDVSLADFRKAVGAFHDLVEQFTEQAAPNSPPVDWVVSDLRGGSATIEVRGRGEQEVVEEVVENVEEVGRFAATNSYEVWHDYPRPIRESVAAMFAMLNGRIPSAQLGSSRIEQPVAVEPPDNFKVFKRQSERTSLKGKIVTLDKKRGTYFTLREAFTNRLVRCWPERSLSAKLGDYWENEEWVLVEGDENSFTNKPTLTNISEIIPLGPGKKGGWRCVFGISPRGPGDSDLSAANLVRKARDGV